MSALEYNKSRDYSVDDLRLIQRSVGVEQSGAWDEATVAAVERWQRVQGLHADGKVGPGTFEAIRDYPGPCEIVTVGAWTGRASLANPERDVDFCLARGINRLDVVINDHSKRRKAEAFDTFSTDKIVALARRAQDAGVEVHLMSWVMPYAEYISEAAEQLLPLLRETGAKSWQWDAEEPWNLAEDGLSWDEAAQRIAAAFADRPCEMGVNGIGFTPTEKFGPLAAVCDYLVPQCYATSTSGTDPEGIVPTCVHRWRKNFGEDKPEVIGLAAYKQDGIPGYSSVAAAMNSSLATVRELGLDTVIYWSLRQIQASEEVAEVIAGIRAGKEPTGASATVEPTGASADASGRPVRRIQPSAPPRRVRARKKDEDEGDDGPDLSGVKLSVHTRDDS